jgi:threonylcarbamoyladenosine tRNA methylthiotransferase MtaB
MPHACIGVDVIVGFPGETDKDFQESFDFISSLDISYLHVFTYSERANTTAAEMGDIIPMNKRRYRNESLRALSTKKKLQFYRQFEGEKAQLLLEQHHDDELYTGFTNNYIKVTLAKSSVVSVNQIIPIELGELLPDGTMSARALVMA